MYLSLQRTFVRVVLSVMFTFGLLLIFGAVATAQRASQITSQSARGYLPQTRLTASDTDYDYFGRSVALSADGNTALVGASIENYGGDTGSGAAYVFIWNGNAWVEQQKLTASDGAIDDHFGTSVALSDDGKTALIGAYKDDIGAKTDQGSAYVFIWNGTTWIEQQKITVLEGTAFDLFGYSVSLSADSSTLLIGAYQDESGKGSAYIFLKEGATWELRQKLTASDGAAPDNFAFSVAVSADSKAMLVGAYLADVDVNTNQGSAYLYVWNGIIWAEQQKLVASDGASYDRFGYSVTLNEDGSSILIGAPYATVDGIYAMGAAYAFAENGGVWTEQQKLSGGGNEGDNFGFSTTLNATGDIALIGLLHYITSTSYPRSIHAFMRTGTLWTGNQIIYSENNSPTAEEMFGISLDVSADGTTALIGAPDEDSANPDLGSAYVLKDFYTTCETVATIPLAECQVLVALYDLTNGTNWINDTQWKIAGNPCVWYGVTCTGNTVTGLELPSNNLVGQLPPNLGNLTNLQILRLNGNDLSGEIPASIADITSLVTINFGYARLTASDPNVLLLLDLYNPDWDATQTYAPTNITSTSDAANGNLTVSWLPIKYQRNGGHYEVTCTSSVTSQMVVRTADKTASSMIFTGLPVGTYTCSITTTTPPHPNNPTSLTSVVSSEVTGNVNISPNVPPNDHPANPLTFTDYPGLQVVTNMKKATLTDDPVPPVNDPNCLVDIPSNAKAVHYFIPGDTPEFGGDTPIEINAGGPGWFRVRDDNPIAADTAIIVYEDDGTGGFGVIVACADDIIDPTLEELHFSELTFNLDSTKDYRVIVWKEDTTADPVITEIVAEPFDLLTPVDGFSVFTPDIPIEFTWENNPNATTYTFEITRSTQVPLEVLTLADLTLTSDADPLACDTTICTLTIASSPEISSLLAVKGDYLWSVAASVPDVIRSPSLEDARATFILRIDPQLVTNSGFENSLNGLPVGWTTRYLSGDKVKCNTVSKSVAYSGVCAFRFKGGAGENTRLSLSMPGETLLLGAGDTVQVRLWVKGNLPNGSAVIRFRMTYQDDTIKKVDSIQLPLGNLSSYKLFNSEEVTIDKPLTLLKLRIKYTATYGKLYMDDVLIKVGNNPNVNESDGLIPLPPVAIPSSSLGTRGEEQDTSNPSSLGSR